MSRSKEFLVTCFNQIFCVVTRHNSHSYPIKTATNAINESSYGKFFDSYGLGEKYVIKQENRKKNLSKACHEHYLQNTVQDISEKDDKFCR